MPKNTGMKNAMIRPRNCSSMCLVRIGDSPTRMPATKAPSTVCTPIMSVVSAITPMITRIAVMTANSLTKVSLTQRIASDTSRRPMVRLNAMNASVPIDALGDAQRIDVALQREAEDHRDDDPADGVVEDRRAEDHLADVAAQEVHLAHHRRHDLHRGDRQRGAEEQRRDQPLARIAEHASRAGIRRARSRRRTE